MSDAPQAVPANVSAKMIAWRKWRSFWNWSHCGFGFLAAALSAVVAANTKQAFLSPIALFRGGAPKASLYEAEARGIDILDKLK